MRTVRKLIYTGKKAMNFSNVMLATMATVGSAAALAPKFGIDTDLSNVVLIVSALIAAWTCMKKKSKIMTIVIGVLLCAVFALARL